jgi:hypothetical protein
MVREITTVSCFAVVFPAISHPEIEIYWTCCNTKSFRAACDLRFDNKFFKLENCKLKMEGHSPADTRAISLAGPPIGLSSGRPDETQLRPI